MTFDQFTVVRVPFPFTDRIATKNRPALVLSDPACRGQVLSAVALWLLGKVPGREFFY